MKSLFIDDKIVLFNLCSDYLNRTNLNLKHNLCKNFSLGGAECTCQFLRKSADRNAREIGPTLIFFNRRKHNFNSISTFAQYYYCKHTFGQGFLNLHWRYGYCKRENYSFKSYILVRVPN